MFFSQLSAEDTEIQSKENFCSGLDFSEIGFDITVNSKGKPTKIEFLCEGTEGLYKQHKNTKKALYQWKLRPPKNGKNFATYRWAIIIN